MKKKIMAVVIAVIMAVGIVGTIHNVAVNTGRTVVDGTIVNGIEPPDW